ncbi:hypothetical protein N665_0230s0035 [Sinapis alba]|nr:hypothetical protein N665_0230s0035 [Sinapis alba]
MDTTGIVLADKNGEYIEIKDIESWGGKMPPGHDYFENGDLDIFSGMERCLPSPYVDVTTGRIGAMSKHVRFGVGQWLAIDEEPHELFAERNKCPSDIQKIAYSIV